MSFLPRNKMPNLFRIPTMRSLVQGLFPALIILLTGLISYLNYTPGTFLTGWDTLHPEFNFPQNFWNIIFGVFRTDQGLGAVAAHSHMVELPRIILLWLFSFAFPLSFLRYSFILLSFILGPLGLYFFIKHILRANSQLSIVNCQMSALLGSLVYIFNLGTVQHFYVPFEMFTAQYATLPWLFFLALKYLEKPKISFLFFFAVVTFFASSSAYASVLWYAYFASLLLFLFVYILLNRNRKTVFTTLTLIILTLLVNAYWILPNLYFLLNGAENVALAQTNKIFSDEAFLYNREYGNIIDTAILRNFLFSWSQQRDVHTTLDLMASWKTHLANPFVLLIGYSVFALSVIGIIISVIKRNKLLISLIPVFLFSLIMVINMNPPFEIFFSFLRNESTLFREALRFPFTKFSILLMMTLSLFFGIATFEILKILKKFKLNLVLALIIFAALIFYGLPQFQGQLINKQMRISIPKEYFEFFKYMSSKPNSARVAPLPLSSMWGWEYYNWPKSNGGLALSERSGSNGFQGAGFMWFGLTQPYLARDFDRWNPSNEQYFHEMSSALYSRDSKQVEALARKYKISYFLLDKTIVVPGGKKNALWHYETHETFKKSDNIRLEASFGNLYLYKVNSKLTGKEFIQTPEDVTFVGPKITGGFVDLAAQTYGDYANSESPDFTYFSRSLTDRYDRVDPSNISFVDKLMLLRLGKNKGYSLTDSWKSNDIFPEFMRESYDLSIEKDAQPFIVNDEQYIYFPINSEPIDIVSNLRESEDCRRTSAKNSMSRLTRNVSAITFEAKRASSCGFITFPAKQDFGSLLIIEARNVEGLPMRLCISEFITNRCSIYTALDRDKTFKKYVFMIPPLPTGASGYAVHLSSVGIGKETSTNEIRFAQMIQIPYYRIANLSFIRNDYTQRTNNLSLSDIKEINPALYSVQVSSLNGEGLLAFYKAYDKGWQAYRIKNHESIPIGSGSRIMNYAALALPFLFGKRIEQHVEVNNWANGWLLEPELRSTNQPARNASQSDAGGESRIVIVYLPQYLEYTGIALLIVLFGGIIGLSVIKRIPKRVI